jgi:small subunit ribosomal protein S6
VASSRPADILAVVTAAFSIAGSTFFPALVAGVFWRRANRSGALAGMLTGLIVCLSYLFIAHPGARALIGLPGPAMLIWGIQPASAGLFGVPAGALALVLVSLLTPAPSQRDRDFVDTLRSHPDQSEQVPAMLERYKGLITTGGGVVHRVEDWGRRQMAYLIQKLAKAHYLCLNIECSKEVLAELETGFRFNDAVLRHLTVVQDKAITTPSVMMKAVEREEARKAPQQEAA